MKKIYALIALGLTLGFTSCGGDDKKGENGDSDSTETANEDLDLSGMNEFDLSGSGLNAKIMVPEEMSPNNVPYPVKDSVVIEGVSWMVCIGENYCLSLEEADGSGNYIANEKKRLEGTGIYDLKYIVDKPNLMLYEANLKGGAGSKAFYHVFGVAKIEGKDFVLKSSDAGDFNKGQAEKMLKTIQALQK